MAIQESAVNQAFNPVTLISITIRSQSQQNWRKSVLISTLIEGDFRFASVKKFADKQLHFVLELIYFCKQSPFYGLVFHFAHSMWQYWNKIQRNHSSVNESSQVFWSVNHRCLIRQFDYLNIKHTNGSIRSDALLLSASTAASTHARGSQFLLLKIIANSINSENV